MSDGRFAAGPSTSEVDDSFGYFAGAPTNAAAPTTSTSNQFGAPVMPAAPTAPPAPPRRASKQTALLIAVAVSVLAVLGAGGWWWMHRGDIVLPQHLGALTRNTDPTVTKALAQAETQAEQTAQFKNGQNKIADAAYISGQEQAFLIIVRGPQVAQQVAGQNAQAAGVEHFGPVLCAGAGGNASCLRAEGNQIVLVLGTGGASTADTASWVQQAWFAQ